MSGTYFLGRVIKAGPNFDQSKLLEAIFKSHPHQSGQSLWSFIDLEVGFVDGKKYIFGRLAKYKTDGVFEVVEEVTKSTADSHMKNPLEAAAPFVYIPDYSGISFLNVSKEIPEKVFRTKFSKIIEEYYDNMFVEVKIELISNYTKFSQRLSKLDSILEMSASVHLPNPLFGHLWRGLDSELRTRNSQSMDLRERAKDNSGIHSDLKNLVENFQASIEDEGLKVSLADAAVLMAADGYGKGVVTGRQGEDIIVVRTDKSELSFRLMGDSNEDTLAIQTIAILQRISRDRKMEHR